MFEITGFDVVVDFSATVLPGSFNPVLGFLCVATREPLSAKRFPYMFQSRTGFSMRRDNEHITNAWPNILLVSIPYWVFYASRPRSSHSSPVSTNTFQSRTGFSMRRDMLSSKSPGGFTDRFNPVLGFLCVATYPPLYHGCSSKCFNPVLGFLCVATKSVGFGMDDVGPFQSRTGFSMRRDTRLNCW